MSCLWALLYPGASGGGKALPCSNIHVPAGSHTHTHIHTLPLCCRLIVTFCANPSHNLTRSPNIFDSHSFLSSRSASWQGDAHHKAAPRRACRTHHQVLQRSARDYGDACDFAPVADECRIPAFPALLHLCRAGHRIVRESALKVHALLALLPPLTRARSAALFCIAER